MKSLFFAIILCLGFTVTSNAQEDTTYAKVVFEMMAVSGAEANTNAVMDQLFSLFKTQHGDVPNTFWAEFEKEFRETSFKEFVTMCIPIYQKHLTKEDLQAAIDFYKTPAGKKLAEKTPLITTESMQVGQQWGMELSNKVLKKLEENGY